MPRTLTGLVATVLLLAGCTDGSTDASSDAPTTTTESSEPLNYISVHLYDEDNFGNLTASECLSATGPGESFDNVPSATFSVMNERMEVIGVLFPDYDFGIGAPTCTYFFSGTFELSERMLIQGPRMQQNGFPVLLRDVIDVNDNKLLADLSLGVNTDWLD